MNDTPQNSAANNPERRRKKARGTKPRPITEDYLERAAFHYLGRYASSSANLHKVLTRKVWRREAAGAERPLEVNAWLDAIVEKCVRLGLVDDEAYARGRAESFLLKGRSTRRIEEDLYHKGLPKKIIEATLAEVDPEGVADRAAAVRFARKKRLGPYAPFEARRDSDPVKVRQKAMGAFSRAGFSYDLARGILDSEDEAALIDAGYPVD